MKNEKILENLHKIVLQLDDENKKIFDFCRKNPAELREAVAMNPCIGSLIADMIATVERDIPHENAKKSGSLSRLKAAERIIKNAKKQPRPALHGAWIADGMQYICDAYRAARFPEPLPLEKTPENIPPIDAARFFSDAAEFLLDFLEMFPDAVAIANKTRPLLGMIYFSTPDGAEGVLLPVHKGVRK